MSALANFRVPSDAGEILRLRAGPPPHIGWWFCSFDRHDTGAFRWWDGLEWSVPVSSNMTPEHAAAAAALKTTISLRMARRLRWNYHWPAGARVPRIDPATGIVTSPRAKKMPPRSPASRGALPPEGALFALGRPGGKKKAKP